MTRKDYQFIAALLADITTNYAEYGKNDDFAADTATNTMPEIVADFARALAVNANFDKAKFIAAATPTDNRED